ncbi:MAG TPA: nuclear transport factor 2 family protein [Thermodesulfobacteriota bacterium]|nr:nuclear transport factor 2 family protein [Thermodesulfobacteriota bacterium]
MRNFRIALLACVISLWVGSAYAGDTMSEGEKLERKMWTAIIAGDNAAVESMIAPGFQSVHEDGARDRAGEIKLLEGLDPLKVQFSDFKVTEQGDTIIITYSVSVAESIDGKNLTNPAPSPRQSVWIKTPSGWQWIAHANLNPITK